MYSDLIALIALALFNTTIWLHNALFIFTGGGLL